MSSAENLDQFAKFQAAARFWQSGAASDILVLTEVSPQTSDDPAIAWHLFKQQFLSAEMAGQSDFELLDDLRTPQGRIRRQISALRGSGGLSYRERLARRLDFLIGALEEEGEDWGENSPESLRQMLLFLQEVPDFRCPTVTVTPSATFRAQWQAGQDQHFAVDFLPDGQVRFVVFAPDPHHPDRVQRVSGVVSRADVMRAIEPYKVHRWAADAGA